jgi:hypothetical protein
MDFYINFLNNSLKIYKNPQTLRNQFSLLGKFIEFLSIYELDASISNKLSIIRKFFQEKCRYFSKKANFYRRNNRSKSSLQKVNKYITISELKDINSKVIVKLKNFINRKSKYFKGFFKEIY